MTIIINNLEYTINMEARTVDIAEVGNACVNNTNSFDYYNAEDCETAEEVLEMIQDHIEETAA